MAVVLSWWKKLVMKFCGLGLMKLQDRKVCGFWGFGRWGCKSEVEVNIYIVLGERVGKS